MASARISIAIRAEDLAGHDVRTMLSEHLAADARLADRSRDHGLTVEKLLAPDVTFWSAWSGFQLIGFIAVKEQNPLHGEIKLLHIKEAHRVKGVGSALLDHARSEGLSRGYRRLSLAIPKADHARRAREFFDNRRFVESEPFGSYGEDANIAYMTRLIAP